MKALTILTAALGATGHKDGTHNLWWIILALVVFALAAPLGYAWSRGAGSDRTQPPATPPRMM